MKVKLTREEKKRVDYQKSSDDVTVPILCLKFEYFSLKVRELLCRHALIYVFCLKN